MYSPPPGLGPYVSIEAATVATDQSTSSTSFTDLATVGPAVTVTVGASGLVVVILNANFYMSAAEKVQYMSFAMSGANVAAAAQDDGLDVRSRLMTAGEDRERFVVKTGLTPGATTFTAKYKVLDGATTGNFRRRSIMVLPL